MNAKLIVHVLLIALVVKLAPYVTTFGSNILLQYQDYMVAGLVAFLLMPFIEPFFD